ncbi:hypothetical protein FB45DRAFT_939145 [Roridomyces roridus]|uniref:Uncharacterized protein n=1 Tax=Roridomyces roridus TaxID=1738132 RepID=A0AAD7FD75_9AGAR|nr:hypothetical protein FB45DRAFT_939145 [Roridomyces roridus]
MASTTSAYPVLPLDLEREIFEFAAYSRPLSLPALMLVAWRVKGWLEPLQYRVLLFQSVFSPRTGQDGKRGYPFEDDEHFSRLKDTPVSLLRHSVRHLYLDSVPHEVQDLLMSSCESIENLWFYSATSGPSILRHIGPHSHLKRFHGYLSHLFGGAQQIDFTHPLFSRLTHLELHLDYSDDLDPSNYPVWIGLAGIPNLTHLSFGEGFLPVLPGVVERCTSLRVIVLLSMCTEPVVHPVARDVRFVQVERPKYTLDWHTGALGGVDYWARAEGMIVGRSAGASDDDCECSHRYFCAAGYDVLLQSRAFDLEHTLDFIGPVF